MREKGQYIGASSLEVASDLIHSYDVRDFMLVGYVPHVGGTMNLYHAYAIERARSMRELSQLVIDFQKTERPLIGFCSVLVANSGLIQIPMMDFSSSIVDGYETDRVKEVMEDLGERNGLILSSGRSYHYYGLNPISNLEWLRMMQRAPEFDEIGPNYPRRQLKEGGNNLRISTNEEKPKMPVVVDILSI